MNKIILLLSITLLTGCTPLRYEENLPLYGCNSSVAVWGFGFVKDRVTDTIVAEGTWKQFTSDSVRIETDSTKAKFWVKRITIMNGIVVYMQESLNDSIISHDWALYPFGPCRWESLPDRENFILVFRRV